MLTVSHLTKDFANTRAVDDLSFEIGPGKVCGFVGPNGAGKTTTMRIVSTLEEPTAGDVHVGGVSIFDDPYAVRRSIGFMPDHFGTYPALTVRDYLEFYARAYEIPRGKRAARIGQILDFTGLDKIAEKEVETLSKGMRQRLNLGRALINDPGVLIMDEPAAGLDPRARIELRYLIQAMAEQGKAIFISSHILSELSEMCDSLLVIDRGRRITFGTFEEIQKGAQKGFDIAVRLLAADQSESFERFLSERPFVADVRPGDGGAVRFAFGGADEAIPVLMRDALNAGFLLIEFRPQTMTMEEVFIRITEGEFGQS